MLREPLTGGRAASGVMAVTAGSRRSVSHTYSACETDHTNSAARLTVFASMQASFIQ
jgi:hypothetical protein